jgi:hypothetical protein
MATYNAMPPLPMATSQTTVSTTVNGRTYTCAVGSSIQVPDFDGQVLAANGWGVIPYIPVGGSRPTPPRQWEIWYDANVSTTIWWNGSEWVRPSSGALV